MSDTDDLMMLDLELKLTIAHRIGCECAPYFVQRREVLLPEVIETADRHGVDAVDLLASFARGVHNRHLCGLPILPERAA